MEDIQSQRRITPSEVPVARAFSKHCNPPMKLASATSLPPFVAVLKLALRQSEPARRPVPQCANSGFVLCAMTVKTSIVWTHFPEFKSHTRIVLSAEPLTRVPPMKCSAVISPICESKISTQQSATEVYCGGGVRGREIWDPSVASSESESPGLWMREEITDGG